MTPTVLREGPFRLFFFSREETRMHVHVYCEEGEAKFWLAPEVELARNHHLSAKQIAEVEQVVKERKDEIADAWHKHFPD